MAHADGLAPVVSISGYPTPTARPSFDSAAPDPTTDSGYWDYRCGLEGILSAVSRLPADDQPHVWEAFNEPDMVGLYRADDNGQTVSASEPSATADGAPSATADSAPSATADSAPDGQTAVCTPSAAGSGDGAAKAACDYLLAARVIHQFAGHADDTVLAGVFSRLSPTYLAQYIAQLSRALPPGEFPSNWAAHDYRGVTRGYQGASLAGLQAFDRALAADSGGRAEALWITETGMLLSSRSRSGGCPAAGTDPAGTLGACINGNGPAQAADIISFFALARAGSAVPITHVFWYQWQGEPDWDSGITDATGAPRPIWCAFFGSGDCGADADAS